MFFDKDYVAQYAFEDNDFTNDNSMAAYVKGKKRNKKHSEAKRMRMSVGEADFKLPEFECPK